MKRTLIVLPLCIGLSGCFAETMFVIGTIDTVVSFANGVYMVDKNIRQRKVRKERELREAQGYELVGDNADAITDRPAADGEVPMRLSYELAGLSAQRLPTAPYIASEL